MSATVPGTVHTDLFDNKQIPNLYTGCTNKQLAWIDSLGWEYCRTFELPKSFDLNKPISLVFQGIDTYAKVYVNDSLLFSANNMFVRWDVECSKFVHHGNNSIRLVFEPAIEIAQQKFDSLGFKLPDGQWNQVRKAPYHFGWDWGPRYVTCGIWKSVYLQQKPELSIQNTAITTQSIDSAEAIMNINFDYTSTNKQEFIVEVVDEDNNKELYKSAITADANNGSFAETFSIKNPELWWPNGHGNQHLYRLRINVHKGLKKVYSNTLKVGVRTVKLINEPDSIGESFYFEVNGKPMFAKGTNIIPPHCFIPEYSDSAWASLAQTAQQGNFNMVRIWGGGIYPPNVFFEACSECGILVWQDFMFACSMYPYSSDFISNVRTEATQQVKRLRQYTSLALWCGNNESSEGWYNWGWQNGFSRERADSIWNGYKQLFEVELKSIVKTYDNTRNYWPSSPKNGWGRRESMTHGDSHYWGVWWGIEPINKYREKVPRFMSEYGIQGAPSMQTIKLFSSNGQLPDSAQMLCHQKHPTGYQTIRAYIDMEGFETESLSEWIYASQVTQAIAYKTAIEAQRLAAPRCMGTLFWQLNDCWPSVSWSTVDYLGQWKAAQYTILNCYQTVIADAQISEGNIAVRIVSDSLSAVSGKATVRVINCKGEVVFEDSYATTLQPNLAKTVAQINIAEHKIDTSNNVVCIDFNVENGSKFQSISFLGKLVNSQLANPGISISADETQGQLTISSKYPAYFVQLESGNPDCKFQQNYMHILPGQEYKVNYTGKAGSQISARTTDCLNSI